MTLEERYNRWFEIADNISSLINKIEAQIGSQDFDELSDRHGLSKIDKKLYEALEVAQKAYASLEKND